MEISLLITFKTKPPIFSELMIVKKYHVIRHKVYYMNKM